MPKSQKTLLKARNFTASLKPMWDENRIDSFLQTMSGVAKVYIINHDKDQNQETGEQIDPHTHILVLYETPRTAQGVARLFGVEPNFVEIVSNRVGMLRYLTHMDDPKKHRYEASEVKTNSEPYGEVVSGASMTDREIIEKVLKGEEMDLVGIVSMQKISMAQRLVTNQALNKANANIAHLREQNTLLLANFDKMLGHITVIESNFTMLVENLTQVGDKISDATVKLTDRISTEIKLARLRMQKNPR